jgi:ParB family transcriptional regulator, chromosome partitioning protein
MQAFHTELRLDELDWEDKTFAIRSFLPHTRLESSLEQHGMLCAPWARVKAGQKYAIVDGFKRFEWARQKGAGQVPCLVFPATCSHEALLVLRVEGKLFGPPLNPAEKAQVIAQLTRTVPQQFIRERILPALRVPQRDEAVAEWCRLSEAGEDLLMAAASGEIAERAALELSTWGDEERGGILAALKELRCSASIQMEIAERIREIALRENLQRLAVLQRAEFQAVLKERRSNHRQKTEALRALLTRWRFPRLSARQERFALQWKAAALPHAIHLTPPHGFEGESWQLQLSFGSSQDLKKLLKKASDFAGLPLIESMLSGLDSPPSTQSAQR